MPNGAGPLKRPNKEIEMLKNFGKTFKNLPDGKELEVKLPNGVTKIFTAKHMKEFHKLIMELIDAIDSRDPVKLRAAQKHLDECIEKDNLTK